MSTAASTTKPNSVSNFFAGKANIMSAAASTRKPNSVSNIFAGKANLIFRKQQTLLYFMYVDMLFARKMCQHF